MRSIKAVNVLLKTVVLMLSSIEKVKLIQDDFFNLKLSNISKNKHSTKKCPESKFNHSMGDILWFKTLVPLPLLVGVALGNFEILNRNPEF